MSFETTLRFLQGAPLGLFGAGHLGRAIAQSLLAAGFPRAQLILCHRGTPETEGALIASGLADRVASREAVTSRSRILLYLVRPQNYGALADDPLPKESLRISFLAGIPLKNLPGAECGAAWVRVMPSSPDTILQQNGIAAVFPSNAVATELLVALKLRGIALKREEDFHAFTALGPCLPLALTLWESLGKATGNEELLALGTRHGLADYASVMEWARQVRPRGLSDEARRTYLRQAATPGGITEAIFNAIHAGASLPEALEKGIERGLALARI